MAKLPLVDGSKLVLPKWVRMVRDLRYPRITSEVTFTTPKDLASFVFEALGTEEMEVFLLVLLDNYQRLICVSEINRGRANTHLVDLRAVFRIALAMNASALVTVRNHPSGEVRPSVADQAVWSSLSAVGRLMSVHVLDHIAIGPDAITGKMNYTSASELGMLL